MEHDRWPQVPSEPEPSIPPLEEPGAPSEVPLPCPEVTPPPEPVPTILPPPEFPGPEGRAHGGR